MIEILLVAKKYINVLYQELNEMLGTFIFCTTIC